MNANTISTPYSKTNNRKTLLLFMFGWFIINAFQAAFLGLNGDEAYYWMLSQHLDWGYFDHPPFVTLLIQLGESFGHGPLFTRIGTVLITTLSIGVIYAALPDHLKNIKWYLWLFAATLLFNVYSFITTPDAPLLFFSAVFFYAYKKYLQKDSFSHVLLMALGITGMFYSKYHGILPVFFVIVSNLKLLQKKSFWIMVFIVTILFLPHLYWQFTHDWATVRFHLFERATKKYKIRYTTSYLLGQLLVWGPIISIFFYVNLRKIKIGSALMRAHLFNFLGIVTLFLFSTFKNAVEPHWTLVGGTSFIVLFLQLVYYGSGKFRKIFFILCKINIALIIVARILFLVPDSPIKKIKTYQPLFYAHKWADSVYKKANGKPVIFTNSYTAPSLYQFYHPDVKTFGYNTKTYRKTQYAINNADQPLDGKNIWYFNDGQTTDSAKDNIPVLSTYKNGRLVSIDSFNAISNLKIKAIHLPKSMKVQETYPVILQVINTGRDTIYNRKNALHIEYSYSALSYKVQDGKGSLPFLHDKIAPGQKINMQIIITAPEHIGKNRILFSFTNGVLNGNFASPYYPVYITAP